MIDSYFLLPLIVVLVKGVIIHLMRQVMHILFQIEIMVLKVI